jgi:alpha-mannosidase
MAKAKSKKPSIHLICNAHLDPVWQWRWEEGCAEAISTFRNAAKLLGEHDKLIFNHNEALLYRWVKKCDPRLFKEIQKLVEEGRWFVSGGWFLQPDLNLPGTESLIRQITEGLRFFRDHFNARPKVAYNFDSFGHSGGLPQMLRLAGYEMYIHLRPQHPDLILPSDLYRWRGVDGTEINCLRISIGLYHTEYWNIEQRLQEGREMALRLKRDVPLFWGIGNHGGGPTREDLKRIDSFAKKEERVQIIHSTPDIFYEAVKEALKSAPVFEGDLQRVFTGCYTSLSRIKRRAQQSLGQLVQAEALGACSWWLFGQKYPQEELEEAWRNHLFNDFHDVITGTCVEPVERDALDLYGRASESARRISLGAASAFNAHVFNQCPGHDSHWPLTVLNSNTEIKRVPVEVECMISHRPKLEGKWNVRTFEPSGKQIPCQEEQPEALLPFNKWRRKLVFISELPGVGFKNFRLEAFEREKKEKTAGSSLSLKQALKFKVGKKSGLVERLEAARGLQCLAGPLFEPLVIEDRGDSWGTDCWQYRKTLGRFKLEPGSTKTIAKGPIRAISESVFSYRKSKIVIQTISYSGWPLLEFRIRVHWNEERKLLKLSIPTAFKEKFLYCEVPGGIIKRPADGEEHVCGRWFMVRGKLKGKDSALGVVNNGQHGLDFKDGEVRLSLLRSAAYCHEQGFRLDKHPSFKFMDQGVHDIHLLVTAGKASAVLRRLPALADWLSSPPMTYAYLPLGLIEGKEKGKNAEAMTNFEHQGFFELLSLQPENIRLLACKRSWDGNALIIRFQESCGLQEQARIRLKSPEVFIQLKLKPLEIKTIRIEKSGEWKEADLVWEI